MANNEVVVPNAMSPPMEADFPRLMAKDVATAMPGLIGWIGHWMGIRHLTPHTSLPYEGRFLADTKATRDATAPASSLQSHWSEDVNRSFRDLPFKTR